MENMVLSDLLRDVEKTLIDYLEKVTAEKKFDHLVVHMAIKKDQGFLKLQTAETATQCVKKWVDDHLGFLEFSIFDNWNKIELAKIYQGLGRGNWVAEGIWEKRGSVD